jgi:hypothetical protein
MCDVGGSRGCPAALRISVEFSKSVRLESFGFREQENLFPHCKLQGLSMEYPMTNQNQRNPNEKEQGGQQQGGNPRPGQQQQQPGQGGQQGGGQQGGQQQNKQR